MIDSNKLYDLLLNPEISMDLDPSWLESIRAIDKLSGFTYRGSVGSYFVFSVFGISRGYRLYLSGDESTETVWTEDRFIVSECLELSDIIEDVPPKTREEIIFNMDLF